MMRIEIAQNVGKASAPMFVLPNLAAALFIEKLLRGEAA